MFTKEVDTPSTHRLDRFFVHFMGMFVAFVIGGKIGMSVAEEPIHGVPSTVTATRSAGANTLINRAGYSNATGDSSITDDVTVIAATGTVTTLPKWSGTATNTGTFDTTATARWGLASAGQNTSLRYDAGDVILNHLDGNTPLKGWPGSSFTLHACHGKDLVLTDHVLAQVVLAYDANNGCFEILAP